MPVISTPHAATTRVSMLQLSSYVSVPLNPSSQLRSTSSTTTRVSMLQLSSYVPVPLNPSSQLRSTSLSDNNNKENIATEVTQYLVVVAVIIIVAVLVLVTGLCFVRIRNRSRLHHKVVQNREYEMENITVERDPDYLHSNNDTAPTLELRNPAYYRHDKQTPDSPYSEVVIDQMYTQVTEATQTKITTAHGEEFIGAYNIITPVVAIKKSDQEIIESAAYACVQLETEQQSHAVPNASDSTVAEKPVNKLQNNLQEGESFAKEEASIEPVRSYSVVQVREVPAVPTKSSDFEQYLDAQSALNKGIYSETISTSDFTRNKVTGDTSDPQILGPVYVLSSALHEADQQPAEFTSDNITEVKELGTGQFGEVVLAETNDLSKKGLWSSETDDISVTVAVKKLSLHPSQKQQEVFNMEVKFMSQLEHPNVLRLLGVCYNYPAFIMIEYTAEGDLNQFLQRYTEIVTTPTSDTQIATSTLMYMAAQIADAMQYLAAFNFIHRDLATRNCLVGMHNSIKIGDLGVNTKLYRSQYYFIRGNKLLSIRWMATECFSGKFSEKSDVWAFGVTMWEMFTLVKDLPYPHLSDDEVIHNALKREYRLFPSRSAACPEPVYEIMEQCWIVDLKQRPTFEKLHGMLLVHL